MTVPIETVPLEEGAHTRRLRRYYGRLESRFIYDGLLGSRHFGWYEPGQPAWDIRAAQRRMVGVVAGRLALPPGAAVLDAGCGGGDVARTLAARHGLDVTGVDLCDFHVDMAWKRAARAGLSHRTRFQVADYHRLPFADASFDGVVALETLLHAYDVRRALSEFHRVLRPGGRLVVCDFSMPPDLPAELEEECGAVWEGVVVPEFQGLRLGVLEEAIDGAGFTIESSTDASANIRPMVRLGYLFARVPYFLASAAGAGSMLVNCRTAVETFEKMDLGYGIHTAVRS